MITIFSTPKDFSDIFKIIQINALRSWRAVSEDIQIIILGNSKGSQEIANCINANYIPNVQCTNKGTPILSDLFYQAEKNAVYPIMVYINADIILPKNFLENIHLVQQQMKKFLIIGHRWDMNVNKIIDFTKDDDYNKFWERAINKSEKHACTGIDYFVYNKGLFKDVPAFAVGRWGLDNWLIWRARRYRIPVVDASTVITPIHQNHHYSFHNIKSKEHSKINSEAQANQKIYIGKVMNILDATHKINNGIVVKKKSAEEIKRYWHRLSSVFPEFTFQIKVIRRIVIKFRNRFGCK